MNQELFTFVHLMEAIAMIMKSQITLQLEMNLEDSTLLLINADKNLLKECLEITLLIQSKVLEQRSSQTNL